uniref:Transmembrane protein 254 n=1 Tax=Phallusia mammillata TaxID=59560 RepID=A0A6F9DW38_9ASCI|nr:transmembrane protein 254-like [Phallusia mammillata]
MTKLESTTFFKSPHILWMFLVLAGMFLCHCGCYRPQSVPDKHMGPVGALYRLLVYTYPSAIQVIYHCALLIHFAEALYSIHLTSKYGITDKSTRFKWFVQTLLFGVFSLTLMENQSTKDQ